MSDNNFPDHRPDQYEQDSFGWSCPQTEMETLKAQYIKEKSTYLSYNSNLSSADMSGVLQQPQQYQPQHSQRGRLTSFNDNNSSRSSMDSSFTDNSVDKLSPSSSLRVMKPPPVSNYSESSPLSCPQADMERLRSRYLREKSTSCLSHTSSQSSMDMSGLHQHRGGQSRASKSFDSDEDEDGPLFFESSSFADMTLEASSAAPSSRVMQPQGSNSRDNFTDSHSTHGMYNRSLSANAYHPDAMARSCPHTEMERLKAHYMKEKMSNVSFDNQMYGSQGRLHHPTLYSGHNSGHNSPSNFSKQYTVSSQGHLSRDRDREGNSMSHWASASSVLPPDRSDYFSSDQKGRMNNSQPPKEKSKSNIDYKELCNDLGVFSVDSNCAFSAGTPASQRVVVFDCVKQCKAQIILLTNTGLGTEEQLQLVRAEVKTYFPCESAMWASFSGGTPTESSVDRGDSQEQQQGQEQLQQAGRTGRGVIILVLGPLAPRTGWIKSDCTGCVISASARIKPNLPVLTFISCDFGGLVTNQQIDHPSISFLSDLALTEYEKDNLIVIGGNLSGDIAKPPVESTFCMTNQICERIKLRGVNISVVCDSSVPEGNCKSFSEDVLVCQKKKAMTIVGVEVSTNVFKDEQKSTTPLPCLVKLNISGWPKKSFAVQVKLKQPSKADASSPADTVVLPKKTADVASSRGNVLLSRQKLLSDLLGWQKNLQAFGHNLLGIRRSNIHKGVQANCLKQLLTDILHRAQADPARMDTPGFANTLFLNRISSLLSLPEADFVPNAAAVVEQILVSWNNAVSVAISSLP